MDLESLSAIHRGHPGQQLLCGEALLRKRVSLQTFVERFSTVKYFYLGEIVVHLLGEAYLTLEDAMPTVADRLISQPEIAEGSAPENRRLEQLKKGLIMTTDLIGNMTEERLLIFRIQEVTNLSSKLGCVAPWDPLQRIICDRQSRAGIEITFAAQP